jgi:hypothetical protein
MDDKNRPDDPKRSQTQSQQRPSDKPDENQKQQIVDYFKSQGKQPDDVIWEMQGLKLRLKDLS